jgi:hypothetical protein
VDTYSLEVVHTDGSNNGLNATATNTINSGSFSVPIMDDDTVEVTGFIQDLISFDIDTTSDTSAATGTDCDATGGTSPCDGHSNPVVGGSFDSAGYTVSLGNLITTDYNESGDTVVHEDGNLGQINTIGMDLTASVSGGASVSLLSQNGALVDTISGNQISSVITSNATDLGAAAGYGIQYRDSQASIGSVNVAPGYDVGGTIFGGLSGSTPFELFTTNSSQIENGRVLFDLAARANAGIAEGTYTDSITFTATANF